MAAPLVPAFRLADRPHGLSCESDDLRLAGVSLLRKTSDGLEVRPLAELAALSLAAFGDCGEPARLARGLQVVARALNEGDAALAMVAALHLRLPEVSVEGAARIATVGAFLAKYDPNEPRDWRGRWTTEDGGGGPPPPNVASGAADGPSAAPTGDRGGHATDGHPTPIACDGGETEDNYGTNEPRWEDRPEPAPDRVFPAPKVPEGWDQDADGQTVRVPRLRNGQPWPVVTRDVVFSSLTSQPNGKPPSMVLYVPIDGKGPLLVGSGPMGDFEKPPGYDEVRFIGVPQETYNNNGRTNHAIDGVDAALRDAETNRYEAFYFNSAITTSTGGRVVSLLRPDVMAVSRPEIDPSVRYWPYESFSPRQDPDARALQLRLHPSIGSPRGQFYKFLRLLWARYVRRFGGG